MSEQRPFDPVQFKTAMQAQWDRVGAGWNEQTPYIHAWLADATTMMLDEAHIGPGARVLDVAAGAGDQTLEIAKRVGPNGSVLATDLSPTILEFAKDNARRAGFTNVDTKVADGEDLQLDAEHFDAAICRLGLMFYPDPLKGLREMHHAVKAGGRVCTLVFSEPGKNPCLGILISTALEHAHRTPRDPYQPGGLLSLGKPGLIDELFVAAGFSQVHTTKVAATYRYPSAKAYLGFIRPAAGPIANILRKLDDTAKAAAWADIEKRLEVFQTPRGWEGPSELLLTAGTR
jgi:SAM-dependent methyltransferase